MTVHRHWTTRGRAMSQVSPPNYKTITLGRGKHASPYEGACVMELASMIAGEPFNDHRRQDLYRYASMAIGTRGSREVEERRVARCLEWAREMSRRRSWFDRLQHPVRIARGWDRLAAAAGCAAAHEIRRHSDDTHAAALSFVEELCAMSDPEPRSSAAGRTAGPTRVRERVSPGSGVSSTA